MSGEPQYLGQNDPPVPETSGMAIASFVLGLFSFVTCFFAGVPAIILGALSVGRIDRSGGALKGKGLATAGIICGAIGSMMMFSLIPIAVVALPAIKAARQGAQRATAANELKQIGLAIHQQVDTSTTKQFPAPASYDAQGRPLLSWRVHLLPLLGEQALYQQFHLSEPWDSPHNRSLLPQMPRVFGRGRVDDNTTTHYVLATGKGAMFAGTKGPKVSDIADGLSNTIMLVEVDNTLAVPWTAPQDYDYSPARPRAGLGKVWPGGFHALLADGSVRFISNFVDDGTLLLLFNPADGSGATVDRTYIR